VALTLGGCSPGYTVPVTIGGQTLDVGVDTGSTTLLVAGASCTMCSDDGVPTLYDPSAAQKLGVLSGGYDGGDETWTGNVYQDMVQIGRTLPAVPVKFAVVSSEKNVFFSRPVILAPTGPTASSACPPTPSSGKERPATSIS
jgi:hypothetical protein